jgi:hypothetical protein
MAQYREGKILTRETVEIDGAEECEEFDAMLWELREVLVDHLECTFKDVLHDGRYLIFHKGLDNESVSICYS